MASRESDSGAPASPANDSIDELLDGLPAEPMLPKKRARTIDEAAAAAPKNRRVDDKVIVSEETDPRLRAEREAEQERRASSTFGTSFLEPNLNWQKAVVGVVMMLAVLGIYAFVRSMRKTEAPTPPLTTLQNMQITGNPAAPIATASSIASITSDPVPPPIPSTTASSDPKPLASTTPHRSPHAHNAGDSHAPVSPAASSQNVDDNLFKSTR
jgi:hypothetical protein